MNSFVFSTLPSARSNGVQAPVGGRGRQVSVFADLSGRGMHIPPQYLRIKRLVGQGSFGEVFEGTLQSGSSDERIIMKRMRSKVVGAEEMSENEHLLNVYVQKHAPDSCADFLGYSDVKDYREVPDRRLTNGKWLLWRYQGLKTLGEYLRKRDCLQAIAADIGVPEHMAIPTVLEQILSSIHKLHSAGLVHRDVKPSNIILCEVDQTFRLIDLGAMADLRTGINYVPDESILDPYYCPPEQYVLPTDAPDLAKKSRVMSLAMSAMLWNRHKPDRFDMYSVGLIMLQLSLPHLRTKSALQAFHTSFKRCRYDLNRWRTISALTPQQTVLLDADDGAGWELAEALLRPRKVQVLSDGHVYFTNEGQQRPSAEQGITYRFIADAHKRTDVDHAAGADKQESETAGFFGMFRRMQFRVNTLESDIVRTAEAAEEATTTVHKLRKAVQVGEAAEEELEKAEGLLANLTGSLEYLQAEMETTVQGADVAFRRGLVGTKMVGAEEAMERFGIAHAEELASALDERSAKEPEASKRGSWGLANVFLEGIRTMGRAVKVTNTVVSKVNEDAQVVLDRYRKSDLSPAEASFMEMLAEADVTASSRWSDVQTQVANDERFAAIVGEKKLVLFRSYVHMLQDVNDLRLKDEEREFMKQLAYRVTDPEKITWNGLKSSWASEPLFKAVGANAAEVLFVRHIAKLQQDQAEDRKLAAAELAFRTMLESLDPPISGSSQWADVRRAVTYDARRAAVPEDRQVEIFSEIQHAALEMEELQEMQAQQVEAESVVGAASGRVEDALPDAPETAKPSERSYEDEYAVLNTLRQEQDRLKAEYEKMEAKLRAMESRLGSQSDSERNELRDVSPRSTNGSIAR